MSPSPLLSVLLPLQDERDTAEECVRAWINQSADPESFEIVALAPREDGAMEDSIRPILRDRDRWIVRPGRNEYELFDLGADEARGEFLFLTEAHCVPERDCVEAMLEELERTRAAGIRGDSLPEVRGPLGALELEMFEEAQRAEEDPDHWRKILIHSLALRRTVFLEAGGTPSRYGDFSTWALAIALHQRGSRVAFSPRPRVRHTYDGDLKHVVPFVRSFRRGEVLYRSERSAETVEPYLEWVPEWERRLEYSRRGARSGLAAALGTRHPGALGAGIRHASTAVVGPRLAIVATRFRAAAAARRVRRTRDLESRRRAFREFWGLTSRRGVLEGLATVRPEADSPPPAAARVDLTQSLSGQALGFHDPEGSGDEPPFRWTEPLASLRVVVPGRARMRATLELKPFQRPARSPQSQPRVAVDNRLVPAEVGDDAIRFEIDPGERWIALACSPLRPKRHGVADSRVLGLPVRSLLFEPAGPKVGR